MGFRYLSGSMQKIEISRLVNPRKWSFSVRILITFAACLFLGTTALGVFVSYTLENFFEKAIQDRLALAEERVRNELNKDQEILLSLVASVAANTDVIQYLAARDREKLMSWVLPYVDRVRNSTGYQSLFFHFHLAPGTSFLRSWNVNQWGDELFNSRLMVTRANKEFKALYGIDKGHKGLSLRAIIPVMKGIDHIGSIEAGLTLEEVFQTLSLPSHFGAAMVLKEATGGESEVAAPISAEKIRPLIMIAGNVDMENAERMAGEEAIFGHYDGLGFRRLPLDDFQGKSIGSLFLFYDDHNLVQDKRGKVNYFVWLTILGSILMWWFLYINVKRTSDFFSQLKRIVTTAQSSNFTNRFKTDHIHCREVLHCDRQSCSVYSKPWLICYVEAGSEAIVADGYKTCVFLDQFKTCSACPVYKANQKDEVAEVKWLINALMRVLNLFLTRSTRMLSEVFGTRTTAQSLSLEEVSRHQEQMSQIAAFSRDLRGVLNKAEAYRLISSAFQRNFRLENYVLMEVNNDENRIEVVTGNLRCLSPGGEDLRLDAMLCRANRVAEAVCSYHNDILCPFFNCDHVKEFRTCLPMVMGGRVGAVFSFVVPADKGPLWRDLMFVLRRYLDVAAPVLSSMRLLELTREQALRDPLTQCHNRRFLDDYIRQYESLAQRHGRRVGFLMMDLDFFKQVNDQYGHQTGDGVLQEVAALIRDNIRKSDLLIRFGGEEFLALLFEMDSGTAAVVADKIRRAVEMHKFELPGGGSIKKTISIGISEYPQDADLFYKSIKFADIALREAKQTGRNRIVRFDPSMWTQEEY
jgi:diguanylate cyclase (GGDEF)-like protein